MVENPNSMRRLILNWFQRQIICAWSTWHNECYSSEWEWMDEWVRECDKDHCSFDWQHQIEICENSVFFPSINSISTSFFILKTQNSKCMGNSSHSQCLQRFNQNPFLFSASADILAWQLQLWLPMLAMIQVSLNRITSQFHVSHPFMCSYCIILIQS